MLEYDLAASRRGFIGTSLFPITEVGVTGATFRKVLVASLLKEISKTRRAPGAGYQRDDWEWEDDSFTTVEHGAEEPIDNNTANVYASRFSIDRISASRAVDRILRAQEQRIADLAMDVTAMTAAGRFTDASATPITAPATPIVTIVENAKDAIRTSFGVDPNVMVTAVDNRRYIRETDQFQEYVMSGGAGDSIAPGKISNQHYEDVFEIDNVLFANAGKNTAKEGQAAVFGSIWDIKYILLAHIDRSGDIEAPTYGRSFHWAGDGSLPQGRIEDYPEVSIRGRVIRARHQVGEKVVHRAAGWLVKIRP